MDEQTLSNWRWGLYAAALADSVFIPVVGGVVEKTGNWVVVLTTLYVLWTIFFGIFGMTFFERSSRFILRCLYYSTCATVPLAFFGSLGNSTAFHLWLPLSLTLGIFVGRGIRDCCAFVTIDRIRRLLLKALGVTEPTLPSHHSRGEFRDTSATESYETISMYSPSMPTVILYQPNYSLYDTRLLGDGSDHNPWAE